jgi:predicted heme/steroid binding protein
MRKEYEEALAEAVAYMEEGGAVRLSCDDYDYEVSSADSWVGGEGHTGYISEVLGNIAYDSAEHVLQASIDHLMSTTDKPVKIELA